MPVWSKYRNTQKYSDCAVVTAVNAYYYLTGKVISDEEHEELVDKAGARYGAAVDSRAVHEYLGIKIIREEISILSFFEGFSRRNKLPLPLEGSFTHKKTANHSALIIGYEPRTEAIRIANFSQVTSNKGWIFLEDLYQFESPFKYFRGRHNNTIGSGGRILYRQYGLK